MTKVEELAAKYAEQQVKDSPNNEYKGYSFELQKELTRFDGYDIEEAYQTGYEQAEKDNALTWEDMRDIYDLAYNLRFPHKKQKEFFEEVLKRFKAQKGDKV